MDLEITVDRKRCTGSGQCVHCAPGVLTQDDEAISVAVDSEGEPEERLAPAMRYHSVGAVTLALDGVAVTAGQLDDWHGGAVTDHRLTAPFGRLGHEHVTLRRSPAALAALAALADAGGGAIGGT